MDFYQEDQDDDALINLVEHIKWAWNSKKKMVLLSFDIKGAFNAAWWQKAITELRKKLDITSLLGTLENYFDQRFVEVSYGTLVL